MSKSELPDNVTPLSRNLESASSYLPAPLCVDLDGTLIRGDLFIESFFAYLLRAPWRIFAVCFWMLAGGKPRLKRRLAERITINTASLPYNHSVIEAIQYYKSLGHPVLLVSGSDDIFVNAVAEHVGLFEEAIGSDGTVNFTGRGKAQLLCERFGEKKFWYMGNSLPDLKVWKLASKSIVVSSSKRLIVQAEKICADVEILQPDIKQTIASTPRLIRVHQWSKNFLIFAPLFLAHEWNDLHSLILTVIAFVSYSAAASFIYVCNDLLDLESDRLHSRKRHRPLASGSFDIYHLFWLLPILVAAAVIGGISLPPAFGYTMLCYVVVTLAYSSVLKEIAVLDVLTLSVLYTLRLAAGAAAADVQLSSWLLLFSLFLFLSLSLVKRYAELLEVTGGSSRRGYDVRDLPLISSAGISSGYICSLVLILYVTSPEVTELYTAPRLLWPIGMLIVFWITRMWLFALRGQIREDPVVFTLKDRTSYVVGSICAVLVILAARL